MCCGTAAAPPILVDTRMFKVRKSMIIYLCCCAKAALITNFEYNDRRKKIIPNKAQPKHTRISYLAINRSAKPKCIDTSQKVGVVWYGMVWYGRGL